MHLMLKKTAYWHSFFDLRLWMAMSLRPELFEGMRFDFFKGLDQKFSLGHRFLYSPLSTFVFAFLPHQSFLCFCLFHWLFSYPISVSMGPVTIPRQSAEILKVPTANYEFGAYFIDHLKVGSYPRIYLSRNLYWKERNQSFMINLFCVRLWGPGVGGWLNL